MRTTKLITWITCKLDQEYFKDWEELEDMQKAFWISQSGVGRISQCEGTGDMAGYCADCPFCEAYDIDIDA